MYLTPSGSITVDPSEKRTRVSVSGTRFRQTMISKTHSLRSVGGLLQQPSRQRHLHNSKGPLEPQSTGGSGTPMCYLERKSGAASPAPR